MAADRYWNTAVSLERSFRIDLHRPAAFGLKRYHCSFEVFALSHKAPEPCTRRWFATSSSSLASELVAQEVLQHFRCNVEGRGLETRYTVAKIKQPQSGSLL